MRLPGTLFQHPPQVYLIETLVQDASFTSSVYQYSDRTVTISSMAKYPRPADCALVNGLITYSHSGYVNGNSGGTACSATQNNDGTWSDYTDICDGKLHDLLANNCGNWGELGRDCTSSHLFDDWYTSCATWPTNPHDCSDNWTAETKLDSRLSSPFTDEDMRKDCLGGLPPFPPGWTGGAGSALWTLDANHYCCIAGKMQYHNLIPGSAKDVRYLVGWTEVTSYPDGTLQIVPRQQEIQGTGDPINPAVGATITVEVPGVPCSITETLPIILSVYNSTPPSPPGTGGPGGPVSRKTTALN